MSKYEIQEKLSDDPKLFPKYFWVLTPIVMILAGILLYTFFAWFVPRFVTKVDSYHIPWEFQHFLH